MEGYPSKVSTRIFEKKKIRIKKLYFLFLPLTGYILRNHRIKKLIE